LNELEFIRGEVYANIWLTDDIVRIDPATGGVRGWIDLSGILPDELRTPTTDVLNGIAYDIEGDRLFVTGKNWPMLYEIRLVPAEPAD
jgi:glutaminyl-peptide cyclotransferase